MEQAALAALQTTTMPGQPETTLYLAPLRLRAEVLARQVMPQVGQGVLAAAGVLAALAAQEIRLALHHHKETMAALALHRAAVVLVAAAVRLRWAATAQPLRAATAVTAQLHLFLAAASLMPAVEVAARGRRAALQPQALVARAAAVQVD